MLPCLATLLMLVASHSRPAHAAQPDSPNRPDSPAARAQAQAEAQQREVATAMEKLAWLEGDWSGTATFPAGMPGLDGNSVTQTERVRFKINRTVLLIEGTGRDADGNVVFQALGTITYNPATDAYVMHAFSERGHITPNITVADDGSFEWGFKVPNGPTTTYRVRRDERGHWVETGDVELGNGRTFRTIEMDLAPAKADD